MSEKRRGSGAETVTAFCCRGCSVPALLLLLMLLLMPLLLPTVAFFPWNFLSRCHYAHISRFPPPLSRTPYPPIPTTNGLDHEPSVKRACLQR